MSPLNTEEYEYSGFSAEETSEEKPKTVAGKYLKPEILRIFTGPMDVLRRFAKSPGGIFNFRLFDVYYFVVVILLVAFGLAVHYSASYSNKTQAIFALAGIILMLIVSQLRLSVFRDFATFAMAVATVFLILVFTRVDYNGTHRTFIFFQPSEVAKVTLILFLAYLMDKYRVHKAKGSAFAVYLTIIIFYAGLVFLESHLSGCILFLAIGYAMMWDANLSKKWFVVLTVFAVIAMLILLTSPEKIPALRDYQVDRILIWKKILFNKEITPGEKQNNARQVLQSLYGIGSGGLFGVGFGESGQKVSNLQEKANDFIFSVLGEELGFAGSMIMLILYGLLVALGIRIAFKSKSYFGSLVALGISTQMALQVLINVAVATSLIPNTGISLPFFSDGGTSMVVTLISMGIMLAISKEDGRPEKNAE